MLLYRKRGLPKSERRKAIRYRPMKIRQGNGASVDRLILLVESRIRGDVYVRFGGELPKTHRSNTAGRWMLSLPILHVRLRYIP